MKNLQIAPSSLGEHMILTGVSPNYYAQNGVKQENPVGFKYDVVLLDNGYEHLLVKIPGAQQMEPSVSGSTNYVAFENLVLKPYVDHRNRIAISATATGIHRVDDATI